MCLSQNTFDLMSGFVGVPIMRDIHLRNLTLIPTRYAWEVIETEGLSFFFPIFILLLFTPVFSFFHFAVSFVFLFVYVIIQIIL